MYQIIKGNEPNSLTQYKRQPDAQYDGPLFTMVKADIKAALLAEQGHLCAYCQQKINQNEMKVEHWACQANYPDEQLSYKNLLGCCKGHEGEAPKFQTCDTKKANQNLQYSPAEPFHHINDRIDYLINGTIQSKDQTFDQQLNTVLNLNSSYQQNRLVNNRAAVIKTVQQLLNNKTGSRTKNDIRKLINKVKTRNANGCFLPFYGVMAHYLEKKR